MHKILLVCSAGMSTSLLVKKMEEAAKEMNVEAKIWAVGDAESDNNVGEADIILLGPQVRYLLSKMQDKVEGKKPVQVINMMHYGTMNGKKVLEEALATLQG